MNRPLYDRIHNDPSHSKFVTKWLTPVNGKRLSKPSIAITNGWMSAHHKNQWYADALSPFLNVFAYDSRGQGESPQHGELNAIQTGIDANAIIGKVFKELDEKATNAGVEPGNKILQGNCVGTMALASMFAGGLPLAEQVQGTILISPVSTFSLPLALKATFFLPEWFVGFATQKMSPIIAKLVVSGEDSEDSRIEAVKRARALVPKVAIKQARQIFWKENVSQYWKNINVPSLILVGQHDPIVKIEHSYDAFNRLPYPIWMELDAPDHLLLEGNLEKLKIMLPEFANDPWKFYDENKHLQPNGNEIIP